MNSIPSALPFRCFPAPTVRKSESLILKVAKVGLGLLIPKGSKLSIFLTKVNNFFLNNSILEVLIVNPAAPVCPPTASNKSSHFRSSSTILSPLPALAEPLEYSAPSAIATVEQPVSSQTLPATSPTIPDDQFLEETTCNFLLTLTINFASSTASMVIAFLCSFVSLTS